VAGDRGGAVLSLFHALAVTVVTRPVPFSKFCGSLRRQRHCVEWRAAQQEDHMSRSINQVNQFINQRIYQLTSPSINQSLITHELAATGCSPATRPIILSEPLIRARRSWLAPAAFPFFFSRCGTVHRTPYHGEPRRRETPLKQKCHHSSQILKPVSQ
jgi:hypothetical protein